MAIRLLVIDDSPMDCVIIAEMLKACGYTVVAQAGNRAAALKAYEGYRPDIVTLDYSLGKETGMTVLKDLLGIDKDAKVIIISGASKPEIKKDLLAAGAREFVSKPFSLDQLKEVVDRVAGRRR